MDGSFDRMQGEANCGGTLRDSMGKWIGGFMGRVQTTSPFEAEGCTLLIKGYRKVVVRSDG